MAKLKRSLVWGSVVVAVLVIVVLVVLRMATLSLGPFDRPRQPEDVGADTVRQHLIGKLPYVRTTNPADVGGWAEVYVTVDEQGKVAKVSVPMEHLGVRHKVRKAVEKVRFIPFIRDGKPAITRLYLPVSLYPPERERTARRGFPSGDLSSVTITLEQSSCYGTCPVYRLQVTGDGKVQYDGIRHVAAQGRRERTLSSEAVAALLNDFKQADFFNLDDKYIGRRTDGPTTCLSIAIGGEAKRVINYWGLDVGMPFAVEDLRAAILRRSGAQAWATHRQEPDAIDQYGIKSGYPGGCGLRADGSDYGGGGGDR